MLVNSFEEDPTLVENLPCTILKISYKQKEHKDMFSHGTKCF